MKSIHEMKEKVKQFNAYYSARLKYQTELKEAFNVLSQYKGKRVRVEGNQNIKLLSKDFNEALEKELNSVKKRMEKDLRLEKVKLLSEVVKYVWSHPEREDKLIIEKSTNTVEFNSGDYSDVAIFKLSGELGELLFALSDCGETSLLNFQTKNLDANLKSTMSLGQARESILSNFVPKNSLDIVKF